MRLSASPMRGFRRLGGMGKFGFIVGAGIGFVLGARAGREQYERIKRIAKAAVASRPVQGAIQKADDTVGEFSRGQAMKLTDHVADAVKDKISSTARPKPIKAESTEWIYQPPESPPPTS